MRSNWLFMQREVEIEQEFHAFSYEWVQSLHEIRVTALASSTIATNLAMDSSL